MNTFGIEHTILIAGDEIGISSITMIKYDEAFKNNFDICAEEKHKEGLEWAYEPSVVIPIDLITSVVEKSKVLLDLQIFIKSFYFWKSLSKKDNLHLLPTKRIFNMHHLLWNLTKHGSDVKTQHIQSQKTPIPHNNLGAKDFDMKIMITLSEIDRGSVMCIEVTKDRFKSCTSIDNFKMQAKKMTFRRDLNKIRLTLHTGRTVKLLKETESFLNNRLLFCAHARNIERRSCVLMLTVCCATRQMLPCVLIHAVCCGCRNLH